MIRKNLFIKNSAATVYSPPCPLVNLRLHPLLEVIDERTVSHP
jgi:hypothetical protein